MKTKKSFNEGSTPSIEVAIAICGSEVKLAISCKVSQQAVNYWRKKGKVPLKHISNVEKATNGAVTKKRLLSDHLI